MNIIESQSKNMQILVLKGGFGKESSISVVNLRNPVEEEKSCSKKRKDYYVFF